MAITTCIFDAYGTLFDVNAAARELAEEPGQDALAAVWQDVAAHWRAKQLQYTWIRALCGQHTDFWTVTQDGLDWALERCKIADPELRERLLGLYFNLTAFAEVPAMLADLKTAGMSTGILSNGSPEMLAGAVDSALIGDMLDAVLSVESVGVFKPDPRAYDMVCERFGCSRDEVLFVSSNGWDAAAAKAYGFRVCWVNRTEEPMDRLPGQPDIVVSDLKNILAAGGNFS